MKCTNPKCKSRKRLRTVRTFDDHDQTRREKKCGACGAQAFTVEVREKDLERNIDGLHDKINEAKGALYLKNTEMEELKGAVRHVLNFATAKERR